MDPFASTEEKTAYQDQRTRRRLATGFATVVAIWLGAFVGAAAMDRAHDDAPRLHETGMAEDAPPRGGGAFRVANALEAASGRPIGSPAPRAAFLVDVARPSTFSHDDGSTRLWAVWIRNLEPDFNVSVIERFGPDSFAVLRELDGSNRFVQKSAESTSI